MNYTLINQINSNLSPIEQVLSNRGIPIHDIEHYCNTNPTDILNPLLLDNIDTAIKILTQHIAAKNKAYLQVDSDYDGFSSAALLINYLYRLFPYWVENCLVWGLHERKEHGIDLDFVPDDIKLIIVPDASSNEYNIHKQFYDKGIDIIILDHHEAEYVSPYACVVNNQLDNYPNKTLCGVGITYKFCCRIDQLLNQNMVNGLEDLVATGLIADMMDIRQCETRELIRIGLSQINNPFIKGIIEKDQFHFTNEITQHKIAFYLVPLVNAVTRVGSLNDKKILFESMLNHRANNLIPSTKRGEKGQQEKVVTQAVRLCANVKKAQTNERDEHLNYIRQLIETDSLLAHKILVICLPKEKEANKNLTGLIANEIANEYQRPTLILNEVDDKYTGSGRNFANSPLRNFKDLIADTKLAIFQEGHQSAFGVSFKKENILPFLNCTDTQLTDLNFIPTYFVDFIFNTSDNYYSTLLELATHDDLWGQNLSEPLIAFEKIKITKDNIQLMSKDKNPTLKIMLPNGVSLIKFKSNENEFNKLYSESGFIEINVIGTCALNVWQGSISVQLLIEDYEIIKRQEYYF